MIETSPVSLMKILLYRFDPVTSVFQQNRFLVVYQVGKLAAFLAKYSFFGERNLSLCMLTGQNGNPLDPEKLRSIKSLIRGVLQPMSDADFELVWAKCKASIRDQCKKLRAQHNLLQRAAELENLPVPMD